LRETLIPITFIKRAILNSLKPRGVWYVSFKYGDSQREKDGRSFTDINEQRLTELVSSLSDIDISSTWITKGNRPDRDEKWFNAILVRR